MIELPSAMTRNTKVLLVMDVVESVRIMEQDQDGFVRRWQQLVQHAEQQVLPLHGGRIVKSLGDGLMLEFASAQGCTQAAFAMQHFSRQANSSYAPAQQLHLRMGGHLASFVTDQHDIYGTDVNLTARFCSLAGPGEIVVTDDLRDCLTAELDADIEDLGECHLKHIESAVRAYRIGPAGHAPVIAASTPENTVFRPTIAVIPFEARSNEPEHFVIGELIADGIIAQLSRSPNIRVISRLSTTVFRGRTAMMPEVQSRLDATFVLSGNYIASGGKILLMAELADTRKNEIVWAERVSGDTGDLLQTQSELLNGLAAATCRALIDAEVQQSLTQPMPRLDSSSLLLGGISMMHRSTRNDFERSKQVLEALIERHNRAVAPRAWLAKWYVLRAVQGISDSQKRDTERALDLTLRALDMDPKNALVLAIQGHIHCQLSGDVNLAKEKIDSALALNPNESLAWLYKSVWSSMWGQTQASVDEAQIAADLSPIDPMKYYYDMILACGHSMNRDYARAIELTQRSLKANRYHQPTIRVLMHAQAESGLWEDAKNTLDRLLQINPSLTVSNYLAVGADSASRQQVATVLRRLGLPEN